MCILFVYANGNPAPGGYRLILASNRDEFYARPAAPAMQWKDFPHAFGGTDMESGREGGTWLAISGKDKVIKVGALLNVTGEPRKQDGLGRGPIVTDYVTSNKSNDEYCDILLSNHFLYNAYNFVSIEIDEKSANILHCSNAPPAKEPHPEGRCYGFGNSPISRPLEKVKYGREQFIKIVEDTQSNPQHTKQDIVDRCMELLKDRKKCWPDDELLRRAPNWGEHLSSPCVQILKAGYGTRTRTVILVDADNKMDFFEETMMSEDPAGDWKMTHIQHSFL
ncbi:unnamed protein product [Hermetia illucens]|uniref:Uncharacterized protein n=1 Tax=Hermetia illucens TaxID=343691 RepID=A0A7R8YW46_HERIL|nr:transport and Golgi organization protein 2 [Hermetia illucens]XP_037914558.1 transport and Golgi organization protein 2 [Hermetia illucens]XP_037914559.1 transport and Golgi organization protein 2 [Hermetia illucens]CAD7087528.1 unnamed protein product [Hermetia illucens]